MKIRLALKETVNKCTTVKEFIYAIGKYNYTSNQLTLSVIDAGYTVTLDPRYGFHYTAGKRKELDNQISIRDSKQARLNSTRDSKSTAETITPGAPCLYCGRSNPVKVKGKEFPHTSDNCYCKELVDKNTSTYPWTESGNGKAFLALGKNILPINFKLSPDRKSLVEYTIPKDKPSGEYFDDTDEINLYLSSLIKRLKSSKNNQFLDVFVNHFSPQETLVSKGKESRNTTSLLALVDSGALAGDFISKSAVDMLGYNNHIINIINPTKVCSGLDNACNIITGSIVLTLSFLNEITNVTESFRFEPRILSSSPIDIIIGRSTLQTEDLGIKIPRNFFSDIFTKKH